MARKKRVYVEPKRDLTAFLFTSLMLILLTFFIVLTSMGVQDEKKQKLALNSLMGSFGILPGGSSPYRDTGGKDLLPQSAPLREEALSIRKIRATLNENGIINGMGVSEGAIGVTITLKSNVLFKPGSDVVITKSMDVLDSLVKVLSMIDNHIVITGHTDSVPYESAPYYSNWALSSARALSVLNYLTGKGVSSQRLSAYGMGAVRPITSNSTAEGRALNRRVEITFVGDLPGGIDLKELEQDREEPVKTFQYKGYKFKMEEQ
ncbi:MAG: OmpA family protein [Deltaproteobacteria bacterium]|nr:OmpA family protein [Deltaproteobacteria bacterium]